MDRDRFDASPGAWEFLEQKLRILDEYDSARRQAAQRSVQTEHGNVAEASFRTWLGQFLPRKYGVCRGFIIDNWNTPASALRHHDVIVYDALNAPVLWVDANDDTAPERSNRAIQVRHVMAVLEVKARWNGTSATEARDKLNELNPFGDKLHPNFCSGFVFMEVQPSAETSKSTMDNLMPREPIVGLFGGVVLRGNDIPPELTGGITLVATPTPMANTVSAGRPLSNAKSVWSGSESVEWPRAERHAARAVMTSPSGGITLDQVATAHHSLHLDWGLSWFARFAFNLLDRLEGRSGGDAWSNNAPGFMYRRAPSGSGS